MHASRDDVPSVTHGFDWGGFRSKILLLPAGTDLGPLFKGLPDDLCPCPHWGYVIKGRSRVFYADGTEEVLQAGDICYLPAGHTAVIDEDLEFVEFSRPHELQPVLDHIERVISGQS